MRKKENEVLNGVFFGLQIGGSALLLWSVFHASFLPNLYKLIIGVLIIALALFSTSLMLKRKGRRPLKWIKNTFVTVLATTFCAVGIFIPVFDLRVRQMLTPPTEGALLIDIICLQDKDFKDKAELLDGVVAIQTTLDKDNQDYAINFIQNELKGELTIQAFDDFDKALAANAACRSFILNMDAEGLSREEMLELYFDRYGKKLLSSSYQIKEAFMANAKATIACTLREVTLEDAE